jgi:Tfp pilus assembly protein PilF
MMVRVACVVATLFAATWPAAGQEPRPDRSAAERQVEFGIEVAKHGLWREAEYRFRRATDLDPSYARAFNNLAVAYEQLGELDDARAMYERALALDPDDSYIEDNFELFREIDDRRVRPIPRVASAAAGP